MAILVVSYLVEPVAVVDFSLAFYEAARFFFSSVIFFVKVSAIVSLLIFLLLAHVIGYFL